MGFSFAKFIPAPLPIFVAGASALAVGALVRPKNMYPYTPDDFLNNRNNMVNLPMLSPEDLDRITDEDWLYILTERPDNFRFFIKTSGGKLSNYLSPKRLGRIDRKILSQILTRCPDKDMRLFITAQLATLNKPSRLARLTSPVTSLLCRK